MSTKPDYTQLDRLILDRISLCSATKFQLMACKVGDECVNIARSHNEGKHSWHSKEPYRFLDGRLQALKKLGLIRFDMKKRSWVAAQKGGAA